MTTRLRTFERFHLVSWLETCQQQDFLTCFHQQIQQTHCCKWGEARREMCQEILCNCLREKSVVAIHPQLNQYPISLLPKLQTMKHCFKLSNNELSKNISQEHSLHHGYKIQVIKNRSAPSLILSCSR